MKLLILLLRGCTKVHTKSPWEGSGFNRAFFDCLVFSLDLSVKLFAYLLSLLAVMLY